MVVGNHMCLTAATTSTTATTKYAYGEHKGLLLTEAVAARLRTIVGEAGLVGRLETLLGTGGQPRVFADHGGGPTAGGGGGQQAIGD